MHMSQASWSGDGLIVALTRLWVASTHAPTKRDGVLLCRFRSSAPQGACGAGRLPPTSVLGPGSEVSYIVMLVAPTGDYEGSNWPQMICTGGGGPYASPIADEPERFDAAAGWSPYCWGGRSRSAGATVLADHRAGSASASGDPEPLLRHLHGAAPAVGAHQFPWAESLSMSMSNACSAPHLLSRAFSRSSSVSRS